jgi:hypothetical protein
MEVGVLCYRQLAACCRFFFSTTEAISAARAADGTISATKCENHVRLAFYSEKEKGKLFLLGAPILRNGLGSPCAKDGSSVNMFANDI